MRPNQTLASSLMALTVALQPFDVVAQGFDISLNGQSVVADADVEETVRQVDVRLADADVQISYDALDPQPRLNLEVVGPVSGDQVQLVSETNYPAFIERGEVRLIDVGAVGGPKLIGVSPLEPNQRTTIPVPDGKIVAVYRVYGKRGRFDQTVPLALLDPDARGLLPDREEGVDFIDTRNIRVHGGAVTVHAKNIARGGTLHAFGEVIAPDANGGAVLERILPSGEHEIEVEVRDSRGPLSFGRDIEIDASDWTYFAVADLEVWRRRSGGTITTGNTARLQVFVDGKTAGGIEVTGSLDTGSRPIQEAFRRLGEKDPRSVASRIGADPGQLTFGDDSTSNDLTPTSGRVYLRVQRDESYAVWGDYKAQVDGSGFLRNQRVLYGAQVHLETGAATADGEPRGSLDVNVSGRDQLFGRDVFRGTDGTVYFLSRQDITADTVNVMIEIRDANTGRVVDRIPLVEGEDFLVNAFQGVLRLNDPVADSVSTGLIQTIPGGDLQQFVVVEYEFTPVGFDADGMDASGRAEAWITDDLRLGVTGIQQSNGSTEQTAYGVDLRYEHGDNSFVQLDYAKTDGPGFDFTTSSDAGLITDTTIATAGSGEAYKLEFELDLEDINQGVGVIGGYAEHREKGFSTLDYQVTADTGDQKLYGLYAKGELTPELSYHLHLEQLDNEVSSDLTMAGLELGYQINAKLRIEGGVGYLEQDGGERTDLGARVTYAPTDDSSVYAFAQQAVSITGIDANDRYGLGGEIGLSNDWSLSGEISDGTTGQGLKLAANREDEDGNSTYIGWETDPVRTYQSGLNPRDNGYLVLGGRRQINDRLAAYGENSYDLLGQRRELTAAYGIDYQASDYLTYGGTLAFGQVSDTTAGDAERQGVSIFVAHDSDDLKGKARIEYRVDQEIESSGRTNTDTLAIAADLRWKIDDEQRILMGFLASRTTADTDSLLGGDYVDLSFGYAYRPIDNERMNVLASYRYLMDDFGQEIDGVVGDGPVQKSHVLNLEGNYNLDPHWTLGGKLGLRLSETAASRGDVYVENDAWLAVANARYHLVKSWDVLLEARHFEAVDTKYSETGGLVAVYRHFNENVKAGVGYNLTSFSDDLTDLTQDDEGLFLNVIAQF